MRFAQVLNNKVHWIFESEEEPQFAPNIILVEITGRQDVEVGWIYNEELDIFVEPNLGEDGPQIALDKQIKAIELRTQAAEDALLIIMMEGLI